MISRPHAPGAWAADADTRVASTASAGSLFPPLFPSLLLLSFLGSSPGPSRHRCTHGRESTKELGAVGCQGGPTHPRAPPLLSPRRFRCGGYSWGSRGRATTWLESQMKSCFLIPKTDRQYNVWLCLQINTSAAEIEDFAIVTKPRHYHLKNYYFLL